MKWHKRFFWLLLLFLPTQLGLHFWPEWAGVLGRRIDYLAPTIYLTDVLLFATLFFWFFESFSRIRNQESGIRRYVKRIKITFSTIIHNSRFMILFFGFAVFNIWIAKNQPIAIYKWLKVIEFVLLGWYIVRTKPKLSTLITPLSIGVFYSSVIAIEQFLLQRSVGGPLWWLGERTFTVDTPGIARFESCQLSAVSLPVRQAGCQLFLRPYATFPHPNVLGGFLAAVLPLIALRYLSILGNLKKKTKFFYGSAIIVGIIALLLTFSRSAIVIGILALVFVFFQKKKILFFLAILFLTFSVFRFPFTFFEESFVVRQQLNVAAIKLWAGAPLFGVGLGNFLVRLPEALATRTIYFLQPVHNIYLLLLSEVGVVGFLFLVWFLLKTFRHSFSTCPSGRRVWHLAFGILLVLGLIDHYPLSLQQGQLLLTVLAGMSLTFVH